ncbi:uncharacterized protein LOC121258853 [Juglans microcarpa x Juglans regia]|uniref:uncharacterized protein LOC121258853 n=1 Tax=Juglans microcarpa x Juglans regia TaxID=2249226 RepID=UPI001B7F572B|nr:uncharacterized protein LOC121258853 [Juglans microcarpa x Juglans regia]
MMITNSSEAQESNQISKDSNSKNMTANNQKCLSDHEQVDQDEAGNYKLERFGAVLSRNCSVSSNSGFQSAVKRALSMRRSSSTVSERYCRIHDQSMTLASPTTDHDGDNTARASRRRRSSMDPKKHRPGGKILKACKRLFGL